ncbi:MAG TPA: hypothetical protein VIG99_31890 [Myxococcaceae bacterium]
MTNPRKKKSAAKCLVALATGLTMATGAAGCYSSAYYDPYYYDYTYYDPYYYGYDSWYAYTWVDPIYYDYYALSSSGATAPADLNALASTMASRVSTYYGSNCATATASGATVAYALNGCTGPGGKGSISGNITVTLTQATTGEITLTATSQDLTLNGERYVLDMTAMPSTSGTTSAIAITSRSYAPSRFDSRQAQGTVSWTQGSGCVDLNGQSTGARGGTTATATISGFHECTNRCPSAGTITVDTSKGAFSSTFDGSDQFVVTGPDGTQHSYDMQCNAQ